MSFSPPPEPSTVRSLVSVLFLASLFAGPGLTALGEEPATEEPDDGPRWTIRVDWYAQARPTDRSRVLNSLRKILKQDWDIEAPETVDGHFGDAWKLCTTDPRLPYACGLVHWQHGRPDMAIQRFEQAERVDGPLFAPALQAAAWCRIEQGELEPGVHSLRLLAEKLLETSPGLIDEQYRLELFEWLGQMQEFVKLIDSSGAYADELGVVEAIASASEDSPIRQAFETGRKSLHQKFEQMAKLSLRSDEEIQSELRAELTVVEQALAEVEQHLATDRAELARQRSAVRAATVSKNLKNHEVDQLKAANRDAAATLPGLIAELKVQESVARVRMNTTTKVVEQTVEDGYEYVTETYYDSRNREKTRTVRRKRYKTILVTVPKTAAETEADRANWQRINDSLTKMEDQLKRLQALLADASAAAEQVRSIALEISKSSRAGYRGLHGRIAANHHEQRRLAQRSRELSGWIERPATFRDHVRTIPPYVAWHAESERDDVLQSLTAPTPPKK